MDSATSWLARLSDRRQNAEGDEACRGKMSQTYDLDSIAVNRLNSELV